jgi:hypothetical protein
MTMVLSQTFPTRRENVSACSAPVVVIGRPQAGEQGKKARVHEEVDDDLVH